MDFDPLIKERGFIDTKTSTIDKSLSRISLKIRDVLAPLAKIWKNSDDVRAGNKTEPMNLEEVVKTFHQSILHVGQPI